MRKGAVVTTRSPGERPESTSPPNWRVPSAVRRSATRLAVLVGDDPDEILVADRHHRLFGHHQGLARTLLQLHAHQQAGPQLALGIVDQRPRDGRTGDRIDATTDARDGALKTRARVGGGSGLDRQAGLERRDEHRRHAKSSFITASSSMVVSSAPGWARRRR